MATFCTGSLDTQTVAGSRTGGLQQHVATSAVLQTVIWELKLYTVAVHSTGKVVASAVTAVGTTCRQEGSLLCGNTVTLQRLLIL